MDSSKDSYTFFHRLFSGVIGGAVFCLVMFGTKTWAANFVPLLAKIYTASLTLLPVIASCFKFNIADQIQHHPLAGSFLAGLVEWLSYPRLLAFLRKYIWPVTDRSVLIPVPGPFAFDPLRGELLPADSRNHPPVKRSKPLSWIGHEHNVERSKAWEQLTMLVTDHASDGRYRLLPTGRGVGFPIQDQSVAFEWTVVIGRPGGGKTRMVVEFLRDLSRWSELEGPNKKFWQSRWIRCGAWYRRIIPWACRKPDDPWDVGWTTANPFSRVGTVQHPDAYLSRLKDWVPVRPSALFFDDPEGGSAREMVRILIERVPLFRYPVRLIIVSQTLPEGLFEFNRNLEEELQPKKTNFYPAIIAISSKSGFREKELLSEEVLRDFPAAAQHLDAIEQITDGNPLLVEIALHMLNGGKSLDGCTAEDLYRYRAESILESLKGRGLYHEHYRLLASAALAGPDLIAEDRYVEFWQAMKTGIPDPYGALRACFNLYDPDSFLPIASGSKGETLRYLPCVRPKLIADEFVKIILKDFCKDGAVANQRDQDRIAEFAWKWNPVGVLEAVRRNANRGDDLGRILRNAVPQGVTIADDRLGLYYAMAAAHRPKGRPWPHAGTYGSLIVACVAIKKLDGPTSEALARALFKLARVDKDFVQLYLPSVEECFVHALGQILKDSKYSGNPAVVLGLVPMLVELDNSRNIETLINHAMSKECSSIAASLTKWAESHRKKHERSRQEEICCAQIFRICGWYAGISGDLESARRCIAAVDRIAAQFSRDRKDPEFELERTKVRRNVASHLPEAFIPNKVYGEEEAAAIDEIASHFPIDDREFQLERAKAWERVAHRKAHVGDAGSGYEERAIIDEIANHFPDNDREFQLQRAKAQSDVCNAMLLHENGVSEAAAEVVEKIVSRFPDNDRDLQYTLARAKAALCQTKAAQGDPRFEADTRTVEDVVRRFADDFEFCEILAGVRRKACFWKALRRDPGCMAEAKSVAKLVDEFPGLPSIRLEYVRARVACCGWMVNQGDASCELEAREIDRIVGGVENNRGEAFQYERAQAWRLVCVFWSGRLTKFPDKTRCKQAADIVFEIARQFPRNPEITECGQLCREALSRFDARSSN